MPALSMPQVHETSVHMLADAAAKAGDAVALVSGESQLSFSEFRRCVAGFANELIDAGAAGNRVVLICGNSIDMAIALYAVHAAGAQAVPLNPLYTQRELAQIIDDAEPSIFIYDAECESTIAPIIDASEPRHTVKVGGAHGRSLDSWRQGDEYSLPLPAPSALGSLLYTGGTTGLAKGVNITHEQTMINISQLQALVPTRPDQERIVCMMPMFHVFAMHVCLYNFVYSRACLIVLPHYHPQTVLEALESQRITILPAGPTVYIGMMAHASFADTDFSSLHYCVSGSAALSEQVLRQWEAATGCPITEGYGQTEAGPVLTFNPLNGIRKPGSVGVAVPQTQVEVVDAESGTKVLAAGVAGEIRARGPQIMSGYRNRPTENAQSLRDGWLYTGDIGEFDEDGYLYIRDRKKDMVIVSGYNVYPREIDDVLLAHAAVREAAAVGIADDYRGEVVVAYVTLLPQATASESDLIAYCRENLAKYKVPTRINVLQELPKTVVGKIDKKQLRRL